MNKEKLFDALDGLFAYDTGATDSGIKDNVLKKEIFTYLYSQCREFQLYPDILTEFVKEHYMNPPYGLEDAKLFIEWYDRENNL
jgi:hypothetical protein